MAGKNRKADSGISMKAILTGMNGPVAPVLAAPLAEAGYTIVPWGRNEHPIDYPEAEKRKSEM